MAVRFAELQNPSPSQGLAIGGNNYRATSNFTGVPSLAMFAKPSVSTRDGQQANASVSIGIRIRPHLEDFSKYSEGHLLFAYKDQMNKHHKESDLLTVANLPQINYMFERNGKGAKLNTPLDKAFRGDSNAQGESNGTSNKTLQQFANSYQFLGVTKVNVGNSGSRYNQAFALDVYGRSTVRNVWGKVKCGDRLYIEIACENENREPSSVPGHRRLRPDGIFIGDVTNTASQSLYQGKGVVNPNLQQASYRTDRLLIPIGLVGATPTMIFTPSTGNIYGARSVNAPVRTDSEYSALPFVTVYLGVSVPLEPLYIHGEAVGNTPPLGVGAAIAAIGGSLVGPAAVPADAVPAEEVPAPRRRGRKPRVKRTGPVEDG